MPAKPVPGPPHLAEGENEALISNPHRDTSSLETLVAQEVRRTLSSPSPPFQVGCFASSHGEQSAVNRQESWVSEYPASPPRRWSNNWFLS